MKRLMLAFSLLIMFTVQSAAQDNNAARQDVDRSATGGAQTLEDILRRQRGEKVDYSFRRDATGAPESAADTRSPLGTLGGVSDPELWRALRFGSADVTTTSGDRVSAVVIQDGGMNWLGWRNGPLPRYGGWLLLGTIAFLLIFFLLRGRIRIEGKRTGRTVLRFTSVERFGHWLLAGSFILLAITGLISLFGRSYLIPAFGKEFFSSVAIGSKWIHNNVAWAFMLGLIMVLVMWVAHNLPSRTDLNWLAKGGGLFSKGVHPPAWKFNAGQKIIFWSVILLGLSVSASGLSLLFPFQLPMFAPTFEKLNAIGLPQLFGFGELATDLAPQQEMQFAQLWHAIVAFVMMAVIIAHIYIGSIGMEGAFDAMGSGEVEEQWAREHHSLWMEEIETGSRETGAERTVPVE